MTSYITITDPETDPDAPLTSELAKKWRDNPIAAFEGDPTAVSAGVTLQLPSLQRLSVGTSIRIRNDSTISALITIPNFDGLGFLQAGTVRFTCEFRTENIATTARFRVTRTRAGVDTTTEVTTTSTSFVSAQQDIDIQPGDRVSVSLNRTGISSVEMRFVRMRVADGVFVFPGQGMFGNLEGQTI